MVKKLVVLGAGESGVGTAILGKKQGYSVFVSDKGAINEKYKNVLLHHQIPFEENQHTASELLNADVVMKSPGIPDKTEIVQKLIKKGIKVISEIEFASWYSNSVYVGITGSNGKTTTTLLVHHILKKGGLNVGLAGNIGKSFAQQVAEQNHDVYALEISSFQLDGIEKFAPHIAILTNISPDHLDRYDYQFEKYIDSKFRITMNQTEKDFLIYDADDVEINKWLQKNKTKAQLLPFSIEKELSRGAYLKNDRIYININKEELIMDTSKIAIQGKHNMKNVMASAMASSLLKIRKSTIRESMEDFEGAEHRLENVLKVNGVQYINDSKATNVNATFYALESMKTPTVWIVGGVDKGNDYHELMPFVREKVKAIICLGVDNQKIIDTFSNVIDIIIETNNAKQAVDAAYKFAVKGDTVLLSPACASFDLFENYEDRGRQFKQAVREL
ncbi:MAG: UDP-N-acetylmuramoyl-L-alanine--D-glutamate ligase [Flavobacteriaceae bacterium]|nr:UDP-N-acetylmuramoyl-L-alanine--D-glutamate ligase [Flavobacteriaceae bacterium]